MDAITLLKDDHKTVEQLFKRFEKTGDRAHKQRREIVDRIIEELSVHAVIEEQLFYPVTRELVPETESDVLESLEEHHVVKWLLSELEAMDPEHERFEAKVTVLIENVRHHVEEEEEDYFPKVRDALGRKALGELGEAMAAAKEIAPTHPHPRAPDTPPGNILVGTASGVVDRVTDTVVGVAQGSASAAHDLVARIRGQERPARGTSGSPTSRKAAEKVRRQLAEVVDTVAAARDEAQSTGERTIRTARSGTKATGTSARKAARRTTSTARSGAKQTATTAKGAATKTRRAATASSTR